jgi:sigma-E factor negative regulatory protein RseA
MSEKLRESLSAAMDGEADAFELRRVLDEAKSNSELRDYWHRQHLLRDVLQGARVNTQVRLRERLLSQMQALNLDQQATSDVVAEPVKKSGPVSAWLGRITGVAVAMVTAAVVITNGDFLTNEFGGADLPEMAIGSAQRENTHLLTPVMYERATVADWVRTNAYTVHHLQQNAVNKPGAVAFIRLGTFSGRQLGQPVSAEIVDRQARRARASGDQER